jgi:hypothetical protein
VGRFLLDADQKIQFQPYQHKNFLLNSFGLEALALEPIHRLKDKEAEIRENYQRILHPERMEDAVMQKRPSHIPYWIMAALAVAFLTSTVTWNIHKSRVNKSYTSMLPFDSAVPLVKLPVKSILKQEETLVSEKAIAKREMTPIVSPSEVKTSAINNTVSGAKMSYIVVGAFFDELHAGKVMAEAESKGYVAHMTIDHNNTIYRVNVEVETQNVSAVLQKIKSDFNERAWVFCNNCSLK